MNFNTSAAFDPTGVCRSKTIRISDAWACRSTMIFDSLGPANPVTLIRVSNTIAISSLSRTIGRQLRGEHQVPQFVQNQSGSVFMIPVQ